MVVNDRRGLYEGILREAGLVLEDRVLRHVNRRTGRRSGEYFEEILVARPPGGGEAPPARSDGVQSRVLRTTLLA